MLETLETQKELSGAVSAVKSAYFNREMSLSARVYDPDRDIAMWENVAQNFPQFSEKIMALRRALTTAHSIRKVSEIDTTEISGVFLDVGISDIQARSLLKDLLSVRLIDLEKYLNDRESVKITSEVANRGAEVMVGELGFDGLKSEPMKAINLDEIFESVLTGALRVKREPD